MEKLNEEKLKARITKVIPSDEALKDVEPYINENNDIPEVCKTCWIDAESSCDLDTREKCQDGYERENIT